MCLGLFAVLIKFSLSVEHFPQIRECKITNLDFFCLKIYYYYFRTKKNSNNITGFKSAFQVSLKKKEKPKASHKSPLIDYSQLFLLNLNSQLPKRSMFARISCKRSTRQF